MVDFDQTWKIQPDLTRTITKWLLGKKVHKKFNSKLTLITIKKCNQQL